MEPYENGKQRIEEIAASVSNGEEPSHTVREILSWFDYERRGASIVSVIRQCLEDNDLATEPDFETPYIGESVRFVKRAAAEAAKAAADQPPIDPTFRIRRLEAANQPVVRVTPEDQLRRATTLMSLHDFSQLPVMPNDRDVKGVISWGSIGRRLATGKLPTTVRECMDPHHEIRADISLFDAIDTIVESGYVLVRNDQGKISGIVTTTDLSRQFQQLGEPFLLIGEIENYVRRIIKGRFSPEQLAGFKDPSDSSRGVQRVEDLSLGEYCRILEKESQWKSLDLDIDRKEFIEILHKVRDIRNDIMHFEPDGISDEALGVLRQMVKFFQSIAWVGAI